MAHVYATVAEGDDYLISSGSTVLSAQIASTVALKLSILESVSRRIDDVSGRSEFGSGFGPRIGTNSYDGDGSNGLRLRDDLLTLTTLTLRSVTAGATAYTPALTTDYFLRDEMGGYSTGPYRDILLHGKGSPGNFGSGFRVTDALGVWGHQSVTVPSTTTVSSGLASDAAATTFTTSATPTISPGHTLLIGTEQIYVRIVASTTATIVRGANGSTAAVHANSSAIATYQYDARVHDVCLRLYARRLKARDAGADGMDGGGQMPGVTTHEGEDTIIRRGLGNLIHKSVR